MLCNSKPTIHFSTLTLFKINAQNKYFQSNIVLSVYYYYETLFSFPFKNWILSHGRRLKISIVFHRLRRIQRKAIFIIIEIRDYCMFWFIHKTMLERPTCNLAFSSGPFFQEQNQWKSGCIKEFMDQTKTFWHKKKLILYNVSLTYDSQFYWTKMIYFTQSQSANFTAPSILPAVPA